MSSSDDDSALVPAGGSSDDDAHAPADAATAQRLVKEFEGITNTDEIFAQFSLQVGVNGQYT